jgi:hypothetical protein
MKKEFLVTMFILVSLVISLSQCKKLTEEDRALFDKSKTTTGFTYYKGDDTILPSSPQSAHNAFFRVRFNATAQAALTDNGKLPAGGAFPDGSLIVKELYDSQTGGLALLAIMEKATGNSSAGANWLWAEYKPDGKLGYSVSKKGSGCTGCHSTTGHRDYMRLFELFP